MFQQQYITGSEEETVALAYNLAEKVKPGDVICLDGELGVGKTVFAGGLCAALGVQGYISSPTFALVNQYEGGRLNIYHFDMYRIEHEDELVEIGFEEYLNEENTMCLIEWAVNIQGALPKKRTQITMKRDLSKNENTRIITIEEF